MKKELLVILSFVFSIFYSQNNLKTFSNKNGNEILAYNYYQDSETLANIRHGNFSYTNQSQNGKEKTSIKGKYFNGLKDGLWSWDIITYSNVNRLTFTKFTYKVIKTFNKGRRNGQWYYKKIVEPYQNQNVIRRFSYELNENYINNVLTGKLTYKENQNLPVELNFNKDGRLVGDYLLNYAGNLRLTTNQQGIVTRYNHGKEEIINDVSLLIGNKYLTGEITQEQAKKENISVGNKYMVEYFYQDNVFSENLIKDPNDGEITDDLVGGHYILSIFDPELVELNNIIAQNELQNKKDDFKKKFVGEWKIYELTNKKTRETETTKSDCKHRVLSFNLYDDKIEIRQEYVFKSTYGDRCTSKKITMLEAVFDYENNKIKIADNYYKIIFNGKDLTLDSDTEILKLTKKL